MRFAWTSYCSKINVGSTPGSYARMCIQVPETCYTAWWLISCVHTRARSHSPQQRAEEYKLHRQRVYILNFNTVVKPQKERPASSSRVLPAQGRVEHPLFALATQGIFHSAAAPIPSHMYSRRRRALAVCRRIISYFACQSHDLHYAAVFYEWGLCRAGWALWFSTAAVRLYAVCFAVTSAFYNSYFSLRTATPVDRAALWCSKFN